MLNQNKKQEDNVDGCLVNLGELMVVLNTPIMERILEDE
jgi:hypothetical protein